MPKTELSQFERDLLESVRQAKSGEHARVHTPEEVQARRPGRPVSSTAAVRKTSTTIRFDPDVLDEAKLWRKSCMRTSGRPARTRAVSQERKIVTNGFWVSGLPNTYSQPLT